MPLDPVKCSAGVFTREMRRQAHAPLGNRPKTIFTMITLANVFGCKPKSPLHELIQPIPVNLQPGSSTMNDRAESWIYSIRYGTAKQAVSEVERGA